MNIFLNSEYGRNKLTPKQILSDPILFLAFGFGSGMSKKAPGTMGTLAAIPVYWLFAQTIALFMVCLCLLSV
jgi:Phosphatidylglycerophosphatase A.